MSSRAVRLAVRRNPTGTYLAACVFYATLLEANPSGLPGEINKGNKVLVSMPLEEARQLQRIAWEAFQGSDEKR